MASNQLGPPPVQTKALSDSTGPVPGLMSYGWIQWFYALYKQVNSSSGGSGGNSPGIYTVPVVSVFGGSDSTWTIMGNTGTITTIYGVCEVGLTHPVTVSIFYNDILESTQTYTHLNPGEPQTFTISPSFSVSPGGVLKISLAGSDTILSMLFTVVT